MVDISQTQGFKPPWVPGWLYGLGTEEATINGQWPGDTAATSTASGLPRGYLPDFDVTHHDPDQRGVGQHPTALVATLAKVAVP